MLLLVMDSMLWYCVVDWLCGDMTLYNLDGGEDGEHNGIGSEKVCKLCEMRDAFFFGTTS